MTACRGYLQSLFRGLLTPYVRKVKGLVVCSLGRYIVRAWLKLLLTAEVPYELLGIVYSINVHAVDNGSLLGIFRRDKHRLYAYLPRQHHHGKNAVYAADIAVERYLAYERAAVGLLAYHSHSTEYSHEYRHIVDRAALFRICGGKVYHHRRHRKAYAA